MRKAVGEAEHRRDPGRGQETEIPLGFGTHGGSGHLLDES
jgi:hypothetical protein